MASISLHYWAGARAAAGTTTETIEADTVRAALQRAIEEHADPRYARVLAASSVLIDGQQAHIDDLDRTREGEVRVEVLPPFAGGA